MEIVIEEIVKKLEELKKIQEMKEAKMIEEAVVIMNPKQKEIVKAFGMKHAVFSEACEEGKAYLVTDKDLIQTIRNYQDNYKLQKQKESEK